MKQCTICKTMTDNEEYCTDCLRFVWLAEQIGVLEVQP